MYPSLTGSQSYELCADDSLNVVELFKHLHTSKTGEHSSAVKAAFCLFIYVPYMPILLFFIYFPYKLVQL